MKFSVRRGRGRVFESGDSDGDGDEGSSVASGEEMGEERKRESESRVDMEG